jgi:xanthine dehydrogenase iron-sulfur cluster and FAD-binding subunit A
MAGNLCRCTGYAGIIRAIKAAAAEGAGTGASVGAVSGTSASVGGRS